MTKIIPVIKREDEYETYYSIGEGQNVAVYVQKKHKGLYREFKTLINWSCFGSVSIERAEQMVKELKKGIGIAKKERKKYNDQN